MRAETYERHVERPLQPRGFDCVRTKVGVELEQTRVGAKPSSPICDQVLGRQPPAVWSTSFTSWPRGQQGGNQRQRKEASWCRELLALLEAACL
jgi:hypothetical protein